jgi:MarR family transcriptional regulator for hemolysin
MNIVNNETLGWLVYKARKLLDNKLQNLLKDCGISYEQMSILKLIYMKEGCNQKELAEGSQKDRASVTRILDILEKNNLVRRENSSNDRREFLLYITDKGNGICKKAIKVVNQQVKEIDSIFSENEQEQFKNLLKKLISKVE